ncbi:MBL fold metallo-hydrolase [Heyndrickxia camelliae]|uniref:MBL fold metallo-hydrolase n=1 Tax=Heyndrickxia camelliae TaxID=1707093 RepID=A0A2N3LLM6_9BACI|nr:MBL fold metallo-hydrolase [Heyndrickxia camelliae]PKR85530.1 MBL fold metallo-hydrolase [Heyndrickxia camelliae]
MARIRYTNPNGERNVNSFKKLMQWQRERRRKVKDLSFIVPQESAKKIDYLQKNRKDVTITWIGHSSFLIQMNGLNIVTDIVWAKRMGLEVRLSEPGLTPNQMPEIDIVLISHSHYDHLDIPSLRKLKGSPVFLAPIGLGRLLERKKFKHVKEFNWWDSISIKNVSITFVPSRHWTKRTLTDTNTSHWGGWVLEIDGKTIYFAGDSGYFDGFKEIGERFTIDYALIPIGAYEPEWFMSSQHINPEQAVQVFLDVRAKRFIPMHYGAFRLADDTPKEAIDRLTEAWEKQKIEKSSLVILKLGETVFV